MCVPIIYYSKATETEQVLEIELANMAKSLTYESSIEEALAYIAKSSQLDHFKLARHTVRYMSGMVKNIHPSLAPIPAYWVEESNGS